MTHGGHRVWEAVAAGGVLWPEHDVILVFLLHRLWFYLSAYLRYPNIFESIPFLTTLSKTDSVACNKEANWYIIQFILWDNFGPILQLDNHFKVKFYILRYLKIHNQLYEIISRNPCTLYSVSPNGNVLQNYSTISQSGYWHWYDIDTVNIQITCITTSILHVPLLRLCPLPFYLYPP